MFHWTMVQVQASSKAQLARKVPVLLRDLVHFFVEELGNGKSYSNTGRSLELRIPLSSSHAAALKTK
ncbi:unnamed protein product [Cyprideis torosa]|uniref:Uncharacterized protein n=1 Tax=Cyprideis torosa TaxID=163714 RepID=A0A7R8ZTI7_9CRUS|nr:unnamed protein product [Cyprideis torosa]CAG0898137.1 unnamed protein product [Cyprideis torosa]